MHSMRCLFALAVLASGTLAVAHPGGLDKNGGHYDKKTGKYHYHRKTAGGGDNYIPESPPTPKTPSPAKSKLVPEAPLVKDSNGKLLEDLKRNEELARSQLISALPLKGTNQSAFEKMLRTLMVEYPNTKAAANAAKHLGLDEPELRPGKFFGKVVEVLDGDTIKVVDSLDRKQEVRLRGIDAPEKNQPFGTNSQEKLSQKILQEEVVVEWKERDMDDCILGEVYFKDRSVNLDMVKAGFAWHYTKHSKSKELAEAEAEARKAKSGLWADNAPKPPWEFRKSERDAVKK